MPYEPVTLLVQTSSVLRGRSSPPMFAEVDRDLVKYALARLALPAQIVASPLEALRPGFLMPKFTKRIPSHYSLR